MRPGTAAPISYLLPDWMRAPTLPLRVANEARPIFPVLLSACTLLLLGQVFPEDFRSVITAMIYGLGCAAISSVAFGHDFAHRTWSTTLAQPISREQIWRTRLTLSTLAMIPLALFAGWLMKIHHYLLAVLWRETPEPPAIILLYLIPPLLGICVAPWLTLVFRGALAGAVFTTCAPFGLYFAGNYLGTTFEANSASQASWTWSFFGVVFGVLCAVGLAGGRFMLQRLEVVDIPRASVGSLTGAWLARPSANVVRVRRRHGPLVGLVGKELRLQWIAVVPALAMGLSLSSLPRSSANTFGDETLTYAAAFWAVVICVILGALGSAEERQLGVIDSQALLPISHTRQWVAKVAVLLFLGQCLAVLWPLWLLRDAGSRATIPEPKWWSMGSISLISLSLYLSSCCRTTMKTILLALPFSVVVIGFLAAVYANELHFMNRELTPGEAARLATLPFQAALLAPYLCGAGTVYLLLHLAARNHFSAAPAESRRWQVAWLIGGVIAVGLFCLALWISATSGSEIN